MPSERVLTLRELNRALLERQMLLERSPLPLAAVLEQMGALQDQYAPSGYIGLWSRMQAFPRDSLTRALEDRSVVQAHMMRQTIHLATVRDYRLFCAGVRSARKEWWLRVGRHEAGGVDMDEAAALVRRELEEGPKRQTELRAVIEQAGYPRVVWYGVGLWVDMVRVPPSGTWERRRADLYGLADTWLGPSAVTEAEGIEHLVVRYLGAFGPAPVGDIAGWAGLATGTVRPVVESLDLRYFRDEAGAVLVDLPDAPLPGAATPAPVRFLPTWDASLLVHCRRTQILPERFRLLVFNTRTPHSVPVFLVDGEVAGSWRYEGGRIAVQPFEPLAARAEKEVEAEAERLAAFHR